MEYESRWEHLLDYMDHEIWQATMTLAAAEGTDLFFHPIPLDIMCIDSPSSQNVNPHTPPRTETYTPATVATSSANIAQPNPHRPLTIWETSARGANVMEDYNLLMPHQAVGIHDQYVYQYSQDQGPSLLETRRPSSSTSGSTGPSSKHSDKSTSSHKRRRSQTRDAHRALRARRQIQLQQLKEQVMNLTYRNNKLEAEYAHLQAKYMALLEKVKADEEYDDDEDEDDYPDDTETGEDNGGDSKKKDKGKSKGKTLSPEQQFVLDLEMELSKYKDMLDNPPPS
ncbi:hypothetical protein F5884DRAFT_785030 [Xylogone sp. PMI_703]|nr:hypothetical protein F5884DRAFT_785030 [Xylogone sp. PMI_703]